MTEVSHIAGQCLFTRHWSMPNSETFSVPVIGQFVREYLSKASVSVDPFARDKRWATYTNDINPNTRADSHKDARVFLNDLIDRGVVADLILFDPPYSPRQIAECYREAGITPGMKDTQNSVLMSECRSLFKQLASPDCVVLSFGWNSVGMGAGWTTEQIMLVCHGGSHNDTICMAERLAEFQTPLF